VTTAPTPNIAALLAAAARRRPGHPALIWDGGALSWRELEARASGVARRLAGEGVGAGDVVALLLPNSWGLAAALWGGLALGATVAPLNPRLAADERERILGHLRPAAVLDTAPDEDTAPGSPIAAADAPGIILYTSGSTGQPKGVVLSHAALAAANESWAGPVMGLVPDDRVLAALPLAHSFGLNGALLAPLLAGVTVVLQERFAPEDALRAIARHRVSVFPGVATMFARILESPALAGADLSSLRLAVSGAAPCPWPLASEWRRRTGVRIVRGYGMTELFRPISYRADEPTDVPDSVGRAVPGVELRLEADELWIRSPAAMDGYLRAPEETAAGRTWRPRPGFRRAASGDRASSTWRSECWTKHMGPIPARVKATRRRAAGRQGARPPARHVFPRNGEKPIFPPPNLNEMMPRFWGLRLGKF
jgi:long-chain acyl-CoA synthetase